MICDIIVLSKRIVTIRCAEEATWHRARNDKTTI